MQQKNTNKQLIVHRQAFFKEQTLIVYFSMIKCFFQGTDIDCLQKQSRKKRSIVNDRKQHHLFDDTVIVFNN